MATSVSVTHTTVSGAQSAGAVVPVVVGVSGVVVDDVDSPVELVPSLAPVLAVESPQAAMNENAAISLKQVRMPAR
jgi:hypothetical protein